MSGTQRVTARVLVTITYDAARENCMGTPYPTEASAHAVQVAQYIETTLGQDLMYSDPEPTDYIQAIHTLSVKSTSGEFFEEA